MQKPNVLLLTIDSLRADRLGCYGHRGGLTPVLDDLADTGVRFTQAITGGSWTQAAFPVLLTSTYASMYGGCLGPLSPARPSPVEAFAEGGYATAGFSSSPLLSRRYGYDRGFQAFFDLEPEGEDPRLRSVRGGQFLLRSPATHWVARALGRSLRPAGTYPSAESVNRAALDWLAGVNGPFFVWIHYMDVHWPYHLDEELTRPAEIARAWQDLARMYAVNWQDGKLSASERERFITLYEKAVRYTDRQIGDLLARLSDEGHAEDTVVVVVSDHGEEFIERRHWGHVEINLYDEILRVPLIFRLPGQFEGTAVARQVRTLDLMPTLLELGGCRRPEGLVGTSLVPLMNGQAGERDGVVAISERWRDTSHMIAVRTEAFKYIWSDDRPDAPELYDLIADPAERQNVLREYPRVAGELHVYVEEQLGKAEATRPASAMQQPELDESVVARLRDLGYVE